MPVSFIMFVDDSKPCIHLQDSYMFTFSGINYIHQTVSNYDWFIAILFLKKTNAENYRFNTVLSVLEG